LGTSEFDGKTIAIARVRAPGIAVWTWTTTEPMTIADATLAKSSAPNRI
jgi:hypothetical protein